MARAQQTEQAAFDVFAVVHVDFDHAAFAQQQLEAAVGDDGRSELGEQRFVANDDECRRRREVLGGVDQRGAGLAYRGAGHQPIILVDGQRRGEIHLTEQHLGGLGRASVGATEYAVGQDAESIEDFGDLFYLLPAFSYELSAGIVAAVRRSRVGRSVP